MIFLPPRVFDGRHWLFATLKQKSPERDLKVEASLD